MYCIHQANVRLIQISSLLERQTSHNLDLQMTALQNLEKEAYSENAIMRQIAEKSARDSTSVRILTILTLIYLPCTVVSVGAFHIQPNSTSLKHYLEFLLNAIRESERERGRWRQNGIHGQRMAVLRGVHSTDCLHDHGLVYLVERWHYS